MSEKVRVLFVDDQVEALQGMKRILHRLRREWEMEFVESGELALKLMEVKPFDVIVTDMRMSGMDGAELLAKVKDHYPHIARIVLSGQAEKDEILRLVLPAHQYLAKPCDADLLEAAVKRTSSLRKLLASDLLQELVSGLSVLPSLPRLYLEVMEELQSENVSIQRVAKTVAKDIGMTAKILQLVNSSFFGLGRRISDPAQAVLLLGVETVKSLVLAVKIFSEANSPELPGFSLERIWTHSLRVGLLAKEILVAETADRELGEIALTAGVLHDVGKVVLASNLSGDYAKVLGLVKDEQMPLCEAEMEIFGCTHAEVGAYLIGLWGLPDVVTESLAYHHRPLNSPDHSFRSLGAIFSANCLDHQQSESEVSEQSLSLDQYLNQSGLSERLAVWQDKAEGLNKSSPES